MSIKHELQIIISGNGEVSQGKAIQAVAQHLAREKGAISQAERKELGKKEEEPLIAAFAERTGFWYSAIDFNKYIGEGAE